MTIKMYDLAGAEENRRFSPYCWRVRLALAHKGLAVETIPWRFAEKEAIAFSGQGKVPVIIDGDKTVCDSWAIANYLEETYPNHPSLFGGPEARAQTLFIKHWEEKVLGPAVFPLVKKRDKRRFSLLSFFQVGDRQTIVPIIEEKVYGVKA